MSGRSTDTTWDDVKALLGVDEDVPLEQSAEYVDELRRLRDGRQIQAAREAAGLTQTDLARLMGTSQSHVARLETGVTAPTVPTLERISDATGTTFVVTPTPMWDRGPVVAGVLFRERSATEAIAPPEARRRRTRARARSALLPGAGAAALLTIGATPHGRREIAAEMGRTEGEVLNLVTRADRMRVRGVGAEYADLLRAAGVDTVEELRDRNPVRLRAAMVDVNAEMNVVRRVPAVSTVERWIEHARKLDPIVRY